MAWSGFWQLKGSVPRVRVTIIQGPLAGVTGVILRKKTAGGAWWCRRACCDGRWRWTWRKSAWSHAPKRLYRAVVAASGTVAHLRTTGEPPAPLPLALII